MSDQPPPKPSQGDIWKQVIKDMEQRRLLGMDRYGTPLQAHNGRDALMDAYQEALDLCVYLRQAIEKRLKPATHPSQPPTSTTSSAPG